MSSLQVDVVQTIRPILHNVLPVPAITITIQCMKAATYTPFYTKERSRVIARLGLVVKGCKIITQVH